MQTIDEMDILRYLDVLEAEVRLAKRDAGEDQADGESAYEYETIDALWG
mgnify:CR=1 FL=1